MHENDLEVSEQAPAMTRGITLKDSFVVLLPSMPGTACLCLQRLPGGQLQGNDPLARCRGALAWCLPCRT